MKLGGGWRGCFVEGFPTKRAKGVIGRSPYLVNIGIEFGVGTGE